MREWVFFQTRTRTTIVANENRFDDPL